MWAVVVYLVYLVRSVWASTVCELDVDNLKDTAYMGAVTLLPFIALPVVAKSTIGKPGPIHWFLATCGESTALGLFVVAWAMGVGPEAAQELSLPCFPMRWHSRRTALKSGNIRRGPIDLGKKYIRLQASFTQVPGHVNVINARNVPLQLSDYNGWNRNSPGIQHWSGEEAHFNTEELDWGAMDVGQISCRDLTIANYQHVLVLLVSCLGAAAGAGFGVWLLRVLGACWHQWYTYGAVSRVLCLIFLAGHAALELRLTRPDTTIDGRPHSIVNCMADWHLRIYEQYQSKGVSPQRYSSWLARCSYRSHQTLGRTTQSHLRSRLLIRIQHATSILLRLLAVGAGVLAVGCQATYIGHTISGDGPSDNTRWWVLGSEMLLLVLRMSLAGRATGDRPTSLSYEAAEKIVSRACREEPLPLTLGRLPLGHLRRRLVEVSDDSEADTWCAWTSAVIVHATDEGLGLVCTIIHNVPGNFTDVIDNPTLVTNFSPEREVNKKRVGIVFAPANGATLLAAAGPIGDFEFYVKEELGVCYLAIAEHFVEEPVNFGRFDFVDHTWKTVTFSTEQIDSDIIIISVSNKQVGNTTPWAIICTLSEDTLYCDTTLLRGLCGLNPAKAVPTCIIGANGNRLKQFAGGCDEYERAMRAHDGRECHGAVQSLIQAYQTSPPRNKARGT